MAIQRGGKKAKPEKKEAPAQKCPPHNMKQVHRAVDFKRGKKITSLFFECQNSGCKEKNSKATEERI